MSIVVVGSIAFDSVKTPFGQCERALGGAANYFSLAASFFTSVKLVGVVGQDFPQEHFEYLQSRGVDLAGVERHSGKTFHWQGQYGFDLNEAQTIRTDLNVFADFSPQLPASYKKAETVFLANIDPTLQLRVLDQMEHPQVVALDTMNYWIESKRDALLEAIKRVQILFINESELRQLMNQRNIVKAAKAVHALGPSWVVVKRGEYGSLLMNREHSFYVPAFPLEDVFDPTGAGDTFAGGFLGWLDKSGKLDIDAMKESMVTGTILSSFVIEQFSFDRMKTLSMADIDERRRRLRQFTAMPG